MHTYRKADGVGWKVVFDAGGGYVQVGPSSFGVEAEAAAFAAFLNGGRYSPGEIEHVFPRQPQPVDDDSTHPDRPKALDDYPIERYG